MNSENTSDNTQAQAFNKTDVSGWVDWGFSSSPNDKEEVEIMRYGNVEKVKFNKKYHSFNPFSSYGNCYSLGYMLQMGITKWRRLEPCH